MDFATLRVSDVDFTPYHTGRPSRSSQVPPERREFIAWDGEGQNRKGKGRPQAYVLFGCSAEPPLVRDTHIHTFELLDYIISVGEKHPAAFHVGFAFNYDANMILQSLHENSLALVHKNGWVTLKTADDRKYRIEFRPSKWFSVTRYKPGYHFKGNPHAKTTVKIYDLFGFFTSSFIAAYEKYVGPVPDVVAEGKAQRSNFDSLSLEYVERYWTQEIEMLRELAVELRKRLYGAGLRITSWHGPGALASFKLRQEKIKDAKAVCPPEVREAARYAYAGGRFEMFRLGRTLGPIYSCDINSAYPFAITRLPRLDTGIWQHRTGDGIRSFRDVARFGVYRVRLLPTVGGTFLETAAGPLFHRDKMGNISFPWVAEGWYWSPEVRNLFRLAPERFQIVEAWEYIGARRSGESLPFGWLEDTYATRREWKETGVAAELALKLLMNSLYGKLAQRVGWNQETGEAPQWHQLEWAGWVTSHCRAQLWDVMARIPQDQLIAVETDGLYTTMDPAELGISNSKDLGGWEVVRYDEILYVQSGMAWLRKGECREKHCQHQGADGKSVAGCAWSCKRRGLDATTFSLSDCQDYLRSLAPVGMWPAFRGSTTRFVGLGAALMSRAPTKVRHCVWETAERDIRPGQGGKRIHIDKQCPSCKAGLSAYEGAHQMSVRSMSYRDPLSFPHDIPWEGDMVHYPWRDTEAEMQGLVIPV